MNRRLFILLGCLGFLLAAVAIGSWGGRDLGNSFQRKAVSSHFLDFGETGKILRGLKAIQPVENKERGKDYYPSPTEIVKRAAEDRKKWLQLDSYQQFRDKVFCYFEIASDVDTNHLAFLTKQKGEWVADHTIPVTRDRTVYAFFVDQHGPEVPVQFAFFNKSSLKFKSAVFLQKGYHPLIFADAIALTRLFSDGVNTACSVVAGGAVMPKSDDAAYFKADLHFKKKWMVGISKYQKKQGESAIEYTTAKHHPLRDSLPMSDTELASRSETTVPILAIDVADADLYSQESGILKNFEGHGREWERVSLVRLYRQGKEVVNSFTGIRLHGGGPGREKGLINFRLYFRDQYGVKEIASKVLFDRDIGMIKRLAVKQAEWQKWPLNAPIAYDIAHHIGALAPPTEVVQLYLNGKHLGQYFILPSPGEKQLGLTLPEDDYRYYRERSTPHTADTIFLIQEFWGKFRGVETMSETYARQFFDLENLASQLFSFIYCGTADFCQGVALKADKPGSRMFWYTWDMDHSFIDVSTEIFKNVAPREGWQQHPYIDNFFDPNPDAEGRHELCPRVALFKALVNQDPQYREKALNDFLQVLNHKLTDEYLAELLYKNWEKLHRAGNEHCQEYITALSDFFRHRRHFLIKQAERYFKTQPFIICRVWANKYPITLDGNEKFGPYLGYHRAGDTLTITPPPATEAKQWRFNGKASTQPREMFVVPADGDQCQVKIVLPD